VIVTDSTPLGGLRVLGIDAVLAALIRARRCNGEVAGLDNGRDTIALQRMLDADAPDVLGQRATAHADVAARVYSVRTPVG